jgi:hypothetical protein
VVWETSNGGGDMPAAGAGVDKTRSWTARVCVGAPIQRFQGVEYRKDGELVPGRWSAARELVGSGQRRRRRKWRREEGEGRGVGAVGRP